KLAGLTVRYDVAMTSGAPTTVHLEGVRLEIVYRPHRLASTATMVSGYTIQADADKALAIDGASADVVLSTGGPATASLNLGAFDTSNLPPPGTALDSAVLRVVHREGG